MWLHVLDYNTQGVKLIDVGIVPVNQEDSEFSTREEEFFYNTICEKLGHTNFDWTSSEHKNLDVLLLERVLTIKIGNQSEDNDLEWIKVSITLEYLTKIKLHQYYIKYNLDVSMVRIGCSIDSLSDSSFRLGNSNLDIYDKAIYFNGHHKHNSESTFESIELTLGELEKLFKES